MSGVRTFKALDYGMRLYGFWPGDLVAVSLLFVLVHGMLNSLLVDALTAGPALFVVWRLRRRAPRRGTTVLSFVLTPEHYGVGLGIEERRK